MYRRFIALGFACLLLLAPAACGPSEEEIATQEEQAQRDMLASLQEEKQALDELRAELAEARAQLEEAPAEGEEGEDGEGDAAAEDGEALTEEELQTRIGELENQELEASGAFQESLVEFFNEYPMLEGEEPSDLHLQALRMKSDEDILVAKEYIEKGGNYQKAISIYEAALAVDPDNPEVQQALEEAQATRYMTEERFSQVKKGMTEDEVRELLGQPNIYNVKTYEDRGVTAWFYPKNPQRAAAAVFFRPRGGELTVYRMDFDAVETGGEAEG